MRALPFERKQNTHPSKLCSAFSTSKRGVLSHLSSMWCKMALECAPACVHLRGIPKYATQGETDCGKLLRQSGGISREFTQSAQTRFAQASV